MRVGEGVAARRPSRSVAGEGEVTRRPGWERPQLNTRFFQLLDTKLNIVNNCFNKEECLLIFEFSTSDP